VSGSNANSGRGQGGQGTPNGSGRNDAGDLQFGDVEVFDPGTEGDELNTDGTPSGNDPGETVGRGNTASSAGGTFVPLGEVLAGYQARATAALDRTDIPPSVRVLVRAYFDRLSTGAGP
jgi:hypothetical protein